MRSLICILLLTIFFKESAAQYFFPVKIESCKPKSFCLDCGDTKAGYNEEEFEKMITKLNEKVNSNGIAGIIKLQLLVGKDGRACVLSHTDASKSNVTIAIIEALNKLKKWNPAISDGKAEEKTSINMIFQVKDNIISGKVERVDMAAFKKSFDKPRKPEIYNKNYTYKNEHLQHYAFTVWNSSNSNLPNNSNDDITMDKDGLIWLTVDEGLVTFDGNSFTKAEQNITDKGKYFSYYALSTDNNNVKWVSATRNIYSFDKGQWKKYDSSIIGLDGAYSIINNPATGEVFFNADEGITIFKDGNWSHINTTTHPQLPSNRVSFARRDSRNRIWIGTYSGSAMIDENGKLSSFEKGNSVLKGKCITSMDEDENGHLYFGLYEFDRKEKGKVNNDEGIAIRYADGSIKQFTTENSGMPFNHTTAVLYDKKEKLLWIATDRAGLVRFDLKDGWENYHSENSAIPTSYISAMSFDAKGDLWLATRQGLVRVQRK